MGKVIKGLDGISVRLKTNHIKKVTTRINAKTEDDGLRKIEGAS